MALVQDWVDSIRLDIPEPLDATVARQVRYAIQKFFRESESWRYAETLAIAVGDSDAAFTALPANTYVMAADFAHFTATNKGRVDLTMGTVEDVQGAEENELLTYATTHDAVIFDSIAQEGSLRVGVIIQPDRNIDEVPDSVADIWFDDIRKGAMARLLSVSGKDWADPRGAAAYEIMFREAIQSAKREARRDRSRPRRVAKFNPGFAW